jgi:uncharacterized protein (UPF0335 family)
MNLSHSLAVDDGGRRRERLAPAAGFPESLRDNGGNSSRPAHHEERSMSAVEKEQPEAAKTRFAKDQLKAFVERIERLEEEKKTISDDIRDVYAESKGNGFDVKALRAVIRLRKQDAQERQEHELILDTYLNALGMLAA